MRPEVLLDIDKKGKVGIVFILDPQDSFYRAIGRATRLPKGREITIASWKENRDKLLTLPLKKAV